MEKQNLLDIAEVILHEIERAKEELAMARLLPAKRNQIARLSLMLQIMTMAKMGMERAAAMCTESE